MSFQEVKVNLKNYDFNRVLAVSDTGNIEQCYDITVDNPYSAFHIETPMGTKAVSHNTAEIALADPEDSDFFEMKNWNINPVAMGSAAPEELKEASQEDYDLYTAHMFTPTDGIASKIATKYQNETWAYKFGGWRWASNNSVLAEVGMDFTKYENSIAQAGEPGFVWLDMIRKYGRLKDMPDNKDHRVSGTNPCCVSGDTFVDIMVSQEIQTIKIRELVELYKTNNLIKIKSFNLNTSEIEYNPISFADVTRKDAELLEIKCYGYSVKVTPDHHVWTRNRGWIKALELKNNDILFGDFEYDLDIETINEVPREDTYDISNPTNHNFFANGILVHNSEQSLESYELCCLVETFPAHADDYWDFQRTLKFAYLYAKAVTLMGTHWEESNAIIIRNRRIGCSMSGIVDAIAKIGRHSFIEDYCNRGYSYIKYVDRKYSDWLGVTESIKKTSVKPSGCKNLDAKHKMADGTLMSLLDMLSEIDLINFEDDSWYDVGDKNWQVLDLNNEPQLVTSLYINQLNTLEYYEIIDENDNSYQFTPNHMLRVSGKWKCLDEMKVENMIESFSEQFKIKSISCITNKSIATGDIEVENTHSYQLENGWISHNTVSLVAGSFGPGVHHPKMRTGYRTVRVAKNSDLVKILKKAKYRIEPSITDPTRTVIVYFPWIAPDGIRDEDSVNIWEQFKLAADMQKHWADNQVSCTIGFTQQEADSGEISRCLEAFDGEMKSVSLLPKTEGIYQQMPFTKAPREEVEKYAATLKELDFSELTEEGENASANLYCDGGACVIA